MLHQPITFEDEACELAENEHYTLTARFEKIALEYGEAEARRVLADHSYSEDFDTFYQTHRQSFLEEARAEFAEVAV